MAKLTSSDIANVGAGAYSLLGGLLAKRPQRFRAARYTPYVRPAQGNSAALAEAKNEIAQQTSSATRDVNRIAGSDVQGGIAARLGIQANANKAVNQAVNTNAQMIREDENRMAQELNQAEYLNASLRNQENQTNYQADQANYANNQAAARAGVTSALNYNAARDANIENNQIAERHANQQISAIKGAAYQDAYIKAIMQGKDEATAKRIAKESMSSFGIYPK